MFYHVCHLDAASSIRKHGIIFTPQKVNEMIRRGELDSESIGISYKGRNASYFPQYVSMVDNRAHLAGLAQLLSRSRNINGTFDPNYRAFVFAIKDELQDLQEFVPKEKVSNMKGNSLTSEVLFEGDIPRELWVREKPYLVWAGTMQDRFQSFSNNEGELKTDPVLDAVIRIGYDENDFIS